MSLVRLEIPTMIAISESWVNPEKDRLLLESKALTAGLVPILAREHNELLRARVTGSDMEGTLKALSEKALEFDGRHDEAYRSLHGMLTALAMMSDTGRREKLNEIRELLMPEGNSGTQRSYLAESGSVEQAASLLTPEMETLMNDIEVDGRSLMQLFSEWVDAGRKLGDVERERTQLAELKESEKRMTGRDVQKIRYRWIRAVNALSSLLELESDIPEEMKTKILQPLRNAEEKRDKQRGRSDKPDAGELGSEDISEPFQSDSNSAAG